MAIKLCHHIFENGICCKSAALHGRDYCYSHLVFRGRRLRSAQNRARQTVWRLQLPHLEDLNAVQVAVMQVLEAITDDRINRQDAGLILYGLQQAASNLRGKQDRVCFEVDPSAENRCVSYDSFEEDFGLTDEETPSGQQPDSSAAEDAGKPPLAPAAGGPACPQPSPGEELIVARKEAAGEPAGEAAPPSTIIDKLMAVADDDPAVLPDSPTPAASAAPRAARKPPLGLRPPKAHRQSPEEAAALAKQQQATAPECGRLDNGEIQKCRQCSVLVYKRLAQFWEGGKNGDDWLPTTGTIDCLDCQSKHLKTLGQHLDEKMPEMFHLFMILDRDGGESPGDFDNYFFTLTESVATTGKIPDDWQQRMRDWAEGCDTDLEDEEPDEEGAASA